MNIYQVKVIRIDRENSPREILTMEADSEADLLDYLTEVYGADPSFSFTITTI